MQKRPSNFVIFAVVVSLFAGPAPAFASETNGTITSSPSYVWGENIGWMNFSASESAVAVTDSTLTGYIWTANYGWINLSPGGAFGGVTNDGAGTLGGHAWSALLGPISFTGITITSAGVFAGTSNGAGTTAGRINFDCGNCAVRTDWRPQSVRSAEPVSASRGSSSLVQRISDFLRPDSQNNPELGGQEGGQESTKGTYLAESRGTTAALNSTDNQVPIVDAGNESQSDVVTTTGALVKEWWWTLLGVPLVGWYLFRRKRLL